jgi:hypothetical protein
LGASLTRRQVEGGRAQGPIALDIPLEAVEPLLRLAEAKLARLTHETGPVDSDPPEPI